jgi:hypothetical protein
MEKAPMIFSTTSTLVLMVLIRQLGIVQYHTLS